MIIKIQRVKVNSVITIDWQCLAVDCTSKENHQDVYISGLDADREPFVLIFHDPSFRLPKNGDSWTLPRVAEFEVYQ